MKRQQTTWSILSASWAAAIMLLSASVAPAAPMVIDGASSITVDNGLTSFSVSKTNGRMSGLTLGTQPLMDESGARGYFSANVGDIGVSGSTYWEMGFAGTTASYTAGPNFVDIALHYPASASMPMDVTQHYALRDGETGFHVYADVHHTTAMANKRIEEMRFVMRGNPSLFTHHLVGDRHAIMPTPAETTALPDLQDATDQLPPGTAYEVETGKDVYTKYDWSTYLDETPTWGFYGANYGAWVVQANHETLIGGPTKQELTVHQTNTTPVLLGMLVGQHYSTPGSVETVDNYDRAFGPFYVHLNSGTDAAALAADAATYADPNVHRAFYDSLNMPGWVTTANRGAATGTLNFASGAPAAGATIVLADNNADFQFSKQGYQYWTHANADGSFELPNVRPGTYRLSAYQEGTLGELRVDNVTIGAGAPSLLGMLSWQPPERGSDLWQIGTFDRKAGEFRHGDNYEYRAYGLWDQYASEFPNDVDFVIGQSDEATDWNFAHWERAVAGHSPQWNVLFEPGDLPGNKIVTLTIAIAGQQGGNLRVRINGTTVLNSQSLQYSASVLSRSGMSSGYSSVEVQFSSNLLVDGVNTLQLSHASPHASDTKQGIVYDALRLEIDALLGDFDNNGVVNGSDYLAWQRGASPNPNSEIDLTYWRANFGKTTASLLGGIASVPEPNARALAALTIAALAVCRRKLTSST
jgi:rhamnogalacturonan endolyase